MTWLTWRQFRPQAAVAAIALLLLAAALALTGPGLARQYHAQGYRFLDQVSSTDRALYLIGVAAVLAAPVLIGMFWGAPLVTRELDTGTWQLIWTQVTRRRWLASKLILTGLTAVAVAGLLSLAVTWWASPIDAAIDASKGLPGPGLLIFPRMSREIFGARGAVPAAYAAFGFVLGVATGIVTRRTLPAIALFLAAFAIIQVLVPTMIRPRLIAPDHRTVTVTTANMLNLNVVNHLNVVIDEPGAWISAQHTVNADGQPAAVPPAIVSCLLKSGPGQPTQDCLGRLAALGYRQQVSYQPASRFWAFQWDETAVYLGLTAVVAGLSLWWIRRRPA
jgi:hypothetical protein